MISNGRADPVEDQPVRGGEGGDALIPGIDTIRSSSWRAAGDPLEQGQGAVVERRVAPDEEAAGLPVGQRLAIISS